MFSVSASTRRHLSCQGVRLTDISRHSLLRRASSTVTSSTNADEDNVPLVKLQQKVDPKLVGPVINWLLDGTAEMPFIPVKATFESKAPSWLPLSNFCGPFQKDHVVQLDPTVFNHPVRRDILHACVTWYLDSQRTGTASTKHRGEIHGSGRKLRPQKGTGKARLGDRSSPMLRGGGRAHGPKPRDFSTELPRKVRDMGLRIALSVRLRERNILVVPSVAWPNGKTRHIAQRLNGLELGKRCLIVTGEREVPPKLLRATRNLQEVVCKTAEELQVWDVLHTSQIILSLDAVEWLHNSLGKSNVFPKADEHPSDKPSHDSAGIHPSSEGTASEAAV